MQTDLFDKLAQMRLDETLCDVRLQAQPAGAAEPADEPQPVRAHRAVLAVASPYFLDRFTNSDDRNAPVITIQNVEPAALLAIIEYIYSPNSLSVTADNAQTLLSAASLLAVDGVRDKACTFLTTALTADNVLRIRAFAKSNHCERLATAAESFLNKHFEHVCQADEFLKLAPDALAALLEQLVVPKEEHVLDAVLRWIHHRPEERKQHLTDLMQHVRLPLLPLEVLLVPTRIEPLANAEPRVKVQLLMALQFHIDPPEIREAAAAGSAWYRPRMVGVHRTEVATAASTSLAASGFPALLFSPRDVDVAEQVARDCTRMQPRKRVQMRKEMADKLDQMRRDGTLCDVSLQAQPEGADEPADGTQPVRAHRAVLAAASSYFLDRFTKSVDSMNPVIKIQNLEPAALQAVVEYIYSPASLSVSADNAQTLLSAATLLAVDGVRDKACSFLTTALTADNVLRIRDFAETIACHKLATAAESFVNSHFEDVHQAGEILALAPDKLAALLKNLVMPKEVYVLDAVLRWTQHRPEERMQHLTDLMQHVRLPLLPVEVLTARARAEPLISAEQRVLQQLLEAVAFHVQPQTKRT